MPGGLPMATGVFVLYADEESFTFMTAEGHVLSGWITFSGALEDGVTVASISVLMRASDPLVELGMIAGLHRLEDRQWHTVLRELARGVGARPATPTTTTVLVDRRRQWRHARNLLRSSAITTLV